MPQPRWESCRAAARPVRLTVTLRIRALHREVSTTAVVIHQQVHLSLRRHVVPVRGGAFHPGSDVCVVPARPRPLPEEACGGVLNKDVLEVFVFEEAEESAGVAGVRQDGQVDDVDGRVVDVCFRGGEGLEVARVGIADLDVGGVAGVIRVTLVILHCVNAGQSKVTFVRGEKGIGLRTNFDAQ